jgi:pimeloyl-ACP methyl ester carboxylesterase
MDAEDGPDIKQYMTTASVARDMLQIIEKHAEWVAAKLAALNPGMMHETDTALYKPEETKLQYWGFSYGTVLGYTFASMFPSRVGRVILDGVVSSYDYTHSLGNGSLTDNQKAMDSFYTYCLHSGPESCPLTTPNATFNSVKTRVENIIQSLYHNPLAISSPTGPEIITYSDIKSLLFSACYQPSGSFAFIAQILAAIETRTGDFLKQISAGYRYTHIYSCPVNGSTPLIDLTDAVPTYAILCSDGIDQTSVSLDEFTAYWKLLESMSPTSGAIWSMLRMRCLAWSIKPIFKFSGPFTANTSHPILFLSNTADPVTPLRSGREMHAKFPGSGLLVSDHAGHCSIAYPNPCALAHVAVYMQTGKLPQENTLCVPEQSAFSLNSTDPESRFYDPSLEGMRVEKGGVRELGVEQVKVLDAGREFARKVVEEDLFGVRRLVGGRGGDLVKSVGMWEGGV